MQNTNRIGAMLMASFLVWLSVALVDIIASSTLLTGFAVFTAFGSTVALWLVWGLSLIEGDKASEHKAKRRPAEEDARLALLLSMLDEAERQALKNRLLDDLTADGEAVSLAALLEGQDGQVDSLRHG